MGSQRAAQRDQQHREQMRGDKGVRVLKGKRRKRGDREVLVLHGALYAPSVGGGLLHCGRVAHVSAPQWPGAFPPPYRLCMRMSGCWGLGDAGDLGLLGDMGLLGLVCALQLSPCSNIFTLDPKDGISHPALG